MSAGETMEPMFKALVVFDAIDDFVPTTEIYKFGQSIKLKNPSDEFTSSQVRPTASAKPGP